MVAKIVAIAALVLMPLSVGLWRASYRHPQFRRYDATLYKSLDVRLSEGKCGLRLLSMPSKTASKSTLAVPSNAEPPEMNRTLYFRSRCTGPYRITWVVFPMWLPPFFLMGAGVVPALIGPIRRWRRRRNGWCLECGYNLSGNKSGRCPECGMGITRPHR